LDYIRRSHTYEFGIGQGPFLEAHGGSTYCAVATLALLGKSPEGLVNKDKTIEWLLWRQQDKSGFHGRANKPADTCYSFWVGASLEIMGAYGFVDYNYNRLFLMETQAKHGGFSKLVGSYPDVMHSYMGLAALSLMDEPNIRKMNVALNVSSKGLEHLKNRTLFWKDKQMI